MEHVPCLICSSDRATGLYRQFGLPIVRCASCGFAFASPRLSKEEVWTRYSSDYFTREYLPAYGVRDEHYDVTPFIQRYAPLLHEMARRRGGPGKLLEVGVAAGFFLKEAERAGWQCVGTEIMDAAIEFATARLGLDVRKQAAEELSFPEETFDAIAMLEVIEHLYDPRRALRAAWAVLRPGGLLVLTTPNFRSLSRAILGQQWAVISPAEHLYYFTSASLRRLLQETGFTSVEDLLPQPGFGPAQTMNPAHSLFPASRRTRTYSWLTHHLGLATYRAVQNAGFGDTLVVAARRS